MNRKYFRAASIAALAAAPFAVGTLVHAQHLTSADADRDGVSATSLDVPGVLTVSRSEAGAYGSSHWTGVSVLGTEIIGKGRYGWTGKAAAAGSTVDAVNARTCPNPQPVGPHSVNGCVRVLGGEAGGESIYSYSGGSILHAEGGFTYGLDGYQAGATVAPSSASSLGCSGGARAAVAEAFVSRRGAGSQIVTVDESTAYPDCG